MLSDKKSGAVRDQNEIRFETYRNYLTGIRSYLTETYQDWEQFADIWTEKTRTLQRNPNLDLTRIERFMKLAWNTEFLLSSGQSEPEMIRINNQWTPIQCYYAIYTATEALCYALDGQKFDKHAKTLRRATEYFTKCGLAPWNLAFTGAHGKNRKEAQPKNFPEDTKIAHNLQRYGFQSAGMIAKCLKVEHSHRIDERYEQQGKDKRLRRFEIDPGDTGILHFLYRLRVKANYRNMDLFLASSSTNDSVEFTRSLMTVCTWTLIKVEIALARKCRPDRLIEMADRYVKINPRADRLIERRNLYSSIF